ncbi:hypothetical protein [Campylobacter hepaticus]|nr:hypothetical protein [Campylobacter hepaticus]
MFKIKVKGKLVKLCTLEDLALKILSVYIMLALKSIKQVYRFYWL